LKKTLDLVLLPKEMVGLNLPISLIGVEELDLLIEVIGSIYPLDTKLANLSSKTHIEAL
jgi:hypothetical protein